LINHVHSLGMEFGLWVEPEMVNPDSDLFRAHPDWVPQVAGRPPLTARDASLDAASFAATASAAWRAC
jgi:alpha-galactosidase